ncbi:MAG: hypothetical protein GWN56_17850, partial [Nitrosopumilaceae archaeon]|nr:hypothetical protein [Nitrosopumilaceae archaeon]
MNYYKITDADEKLALNLFVNSFSFFFRNHIEKNYYDLDYKPDTQDGWSLKQQFKDYEIHIPLDQIENDVLQNEGDKRRLIQLIQQQFHFYGYDHSVYDYNSFD